jgi:hypothetical protein
MRVSPNIDTGEMNIFYDAAEKGPDNTASSTGHDEVVDNVGLVSNNLAPYLFDSVLTQAGCTRTRE